MTHHPLLDATEVPRTEPYPRTAGEAFRAFRAFRDQDSGCVSCGWRGTAEQPAVVDRAVRPDPAERFTGVGELAAVWRRSMS
ncbi:hypothetical protein ACFY64_26550 [Streptomyces collinus]|uniref:hypothetical protein n=1 Tax=Streptomyces collinus TaxID=42684 RepID=UPI0036799D4C